jgi:dipeptidyl-peptidase 4
MSPDGLWSVARENGNVRLRSLADQRIVALTTDASEHYQYAGSPGYSGHAVGDLRRNAPKRPIALWSPDSRFLLTHRIDERGVGELHLVQSVPEDGTYRPKHYAYRYAIPGDERLPLQALAIFDVHAGERLSLATPPVPTSARTLIEKRDAWWAKDSKSVYFLERERYSKLVKLNRVDVPSGTVRTVIEEPSDTFVQVNSGNVLDIPLLRTLRNGDIIWYSERDGWGHLYYYDRAGRLRGRITSGPWTVRAIDHVDENAERIYFLASGREDTHSPYEQCLYSVAFNGSDLKLLTPEEGDHEWPHRIYRGAQSDLLTTEDELSRFSASGRFFVDYFSRPDLPPRLVLRSLTGKIVMELETGDISRLAADGYSPVEPFKALAADGKTPIYGNLFRPSRFNPNASYPVIDSVYPGPAARRTATRLTSALFDPMEAQSLAELGFIVVTIDGRGTPHRSRSFLDPAYGRMDVAAGLEDHIAALQQLAQRYPYLDLSRVGIDGASGGGFAAALGMFAFPDFYKVGVAAAGNHDQRPYAANWGETYVGPPRERDYGLSATPRLAARLKGKLLLMHGELDDNVAPSQTLRLVDALVAANKDFELLILPNQDHAAFALSPYFIRRKWDFFVRHLQGVEPPSDYAITPPR